MAVITPECACPSCNRIFDRATGIGQRQPKEGDITICIECGHLMAFNSNLTVRDLTDEEMHEVAGDPRIIAVQKARWKVLGK